MNSAEKLAALLSLTLWLGCKRDEPRALVLAPVLTPTHYLGEPFEVGGLEGTAAQGVTCKLTAAEPMLTEPSGPSQGLVAEDLSVVETSFACVDKSGVAVPFRSLSIRLVWLDQERRLHLPSTRTTLGHRQPEHAVFEVPSGHDGLRRLPGYDARSGDALSRHQPGSARLYVKASNVSADGSQGVEGADGADDGVGLAIAPWPRFHDAALDAFLDKLAHALASDDESALAALGASEPARADLRTAQALYRLVLERDAPQQLAVHGIEDVEGQARLTLTLETSGRGARPLASATFRLELTQGSNGQLTIARLLDPEGTRLSVECAAQTAALTARVLRAREGAVIDADCNALGSLLPSACAAADGALLDEALRVGTRCAAGSSLGLQVESEPAPADFEVRLRRGRAREGMEQPPRFSVTLTRAGLVRFEGQHRVSARGPSEGRTSPAMLASLWGYLSRLGFFERTEPVAGERCAPDDRGDLVTVRAHGRERSVRDKAGCRAELSAEELDGLRRAIERTAAVEAWIAPNFPVFSRDAEIWVVAAE